MSATNDRWTRAQEYEAAYWNRPEKAQEVVRDAATWYGWRASHLMENLAAAGLAAISTGSARVIEVGSGPVGLVGYFPASTRVAIDPLNDVYASNPVLAASRTADVEYRTGPGERLPAESGSFDLAIIENCIDHVQDMDGVMRELTRVLHGDGVLYLTVNCRSRSGYWVHRALSRTRLDPGHPHTFTPERLNELLAKHGFAVRRMWPLQDLREARRADFASSNPKDKLKAVLGVSEYAVAVLANKQPR